MSQDGDGSGSKKPDEAADAKAKDKAPAKARADKPAAAEQQPAKKSPEKAGGVVAEVADVPPTRRHESVAAAAEPPVRQSYHDMMNPLITFPDDGPISSRIRALDTVIGKVEQIVLVTLLASVIVIAATHALADKVAHIQPFGHFKDDAIRGGTFAMALIGGAFATHQSRHLTMDLVSRKLAPRARLFLKVVLALFTIFIVVLLIRAGFHTITSEESFRQEDKLITPVRLAYLVPLGGALIILHVILHTIIDVDYIVRRKTPPERMRSGH